MAVPPECYMKSNVGDEERTSGQTDVYIMKDIWCNIIQINKNAY